ncbi:MFS transporter, partial [Flavobacteriaceae bacterium]|nr:MFS transporter [Flavobacteriaceae bacterium]
DDEKIGDFNNMKKLLKSKSIFLISLIILCAYMGYKITDIYSLYASEVMMYDQINAAKIGAYQQYLRPIVCISVGLFSDKTGNINNIFLGFIIMLIGSIIFASGIVSSSVNILFIISLIIVATGTYAIRGLYFSILNDGDIPVALSGTAIGIVSIIGYSPDIFATPLYEQIISLTILFSSVLFIVWISAKIYRIGILMYGKKITYGEIIKWLRS